MPNNGDKPATKSELKSEIAAVRSDLSAVRSEMKEDFKRLAIEIGKANIRMDKVEDRILSELRSFRGELLAAFETSVVKGKRYE
ncbi:MAG: hypothetical protein HY922_16520 [Elusimicrobia bacterium]|nr:hypothetical protein [Elusimicrobiota bacterium]